ncbi:MAG TPA: hypothetical protein VHW23_42075 [Kofleriaceae bacterium]|nr:hypothetical protein [Kofleriaceae bacterium]
MNDNLQSTSDICRRDTNSPPRRPHSKRVFEVIAATAAHFDDTSVDDGGEALQNA